MAPTVVSRSKAGPKRPWVQDRLRIQFYLVMGPLPVSGSNFGALTQLELSVAFAPGDLNICLQGR